MQVRCIMNSHANRLKRSYAQRKHSDSYVVASNSSRGWHLDAATNVRAELYINEVNARCCTDANEATEMALGSFSQRCRTTTWLRRTSVIISLSNDLNNNHSGGRQH